MMLEMERKEEKKSKTDAMNDHESRKIEATRWQPELAWYTSLHRG